jgi:hypothetical protein
VFIRKSGIQHGIMALYCGIPVMENDFGRTIINGLLATQMTTGYMDITYVTVHRIIATAFHGEPPTKGHVVDHIDTNKRNNRPENLRWVTRLENVLLNPITARRIAKICGSIEAFLAEPTKFRDMFPDPNFNWMGTVKHRKV